jgi:hypothetical protein
MREHWVYVAAHYGYRRIHEQRGGTQSRAADIEAGNAANADSDDAVAQPAFCGQEGCGYWVRRRGRARKACGGIRAVSLSRKQDSRHVS